jgi:hypothetical protein
VGTIPVPPDWADALQFDFVYWTKLPTDGVVTDADGKYWNYLKTGADMVHMPYGSPLSAEQIEKLFLDD